MASQQVRREVFYSGRVQGVGFRYRTHQLAGGFAVTGFVRNLPDRRVQLVVEGTPAEVDRFLSEIAEAMADYIRGMQNNHYPATGEFATFEIRH